MKQSNSRISLRDFTARSGVYIFLFLIFSLSNPLSVFSQPTIQASNVVISLLTSTTMTVSWTNGDGDARIVVVRALSPISSTPVNGVNYTPSANFANTGSSIIGGGKVVYRNNNASSVNVTNLSPGTTYYVQVFEFNYTGTIATTNGSQEYLISTAVNNPVSVTTPAASATAQASYISFSAITSTSITLNWVNGNNYPDNRRIVVARISTTSINPVNGTTYTANPIYGSLGSQLSGNAYVVYDGSGSSVTVSNLSPTVRYYFQVYEYTVTPSITYLTTTSTSNPNSQSTRPSIQASSIVSSSVTTTTAVISWTNGNGSSRILVAHEGAPVDALPEDGVSYTDGAGAFLTGSQIGNGNFVVYNGNSNSVTVTNLLDGVYYYFQVFELSGNAFALASYTQNIFVYNTNTSLDNPGTPILTPAKFNYKTKASGAWESNSTWLEYKANPSPGVWVDANSYPVNRDIVQVSHSVTLSGTAAPDVLNVDGTLTVASTGQLTVSANKRYSNNLFMEPISGLLYVDGKLILEDKAIANGNTASNTFFNSGSIYEHQYRTEGVIPLATWNVNSTLYITGYSNITSNILGTAAGNWGQSFGHVIFNCPIAAAGRHIDLDGQLKTINGNLTINSTGISTNGLILISNNAATTINIGGDLTVSPPAGTSANLILSFSGTISPTINVGGSVYINGGNQTAVPPTRSTLTFNNSMVSGAPKWNVTGSIYVAGESRLIVNQIGGSPELNVGNDVVITSTNTLGSSLNTSGNCTVNLNGSLMLNSPGGLLSFGSGAAGSAIINLKEDLSLTAGTLIQSGTGTNYGQINFTSAGTPLVQYFSNTGSISGKINFNVFSNSVLDIPTDNGIGGSGDFMLGSNSSLRVGSKDLGGAFRTAGDVSGSLFNSGLRTYGDPSSITFNGLGNQQVGNDYPSATYPNVSLMIDNSSGSVTANDPLTITGDLFLQNGEFIAPADVNKLTLSGNFQRVNGTFTHRDGIMLLNGTGAQATQTINGAGTEFYTLEVNKAGGGMIDIVSYTPLSHLLNIISPTLIQNPSPIIVNPTPDFSNQPFLNQGLTLLSRGESTDLDARIGPIPVGASVTGMVTAQRYMAAKGTINRYISMPVQNVGVFQLQDDFTVTGSFIGSSFPCTGCRAGNPASLRYYDEAVMGTNEKGYKPWPTNQNSQSLQTGKGYLAYMWENTTKIIDVAGPINTGDITFQISFSDTGNPSADGWNLIGNPYPSAIQWGEANGGWNLNNNSIDPVISVPDLSVQGYPNYYRTWNYVDGSGDPGFGAGDLEGGIIAMGQAFWVKANTSGASLTINENAKIGPSGTGSFYRQKAEGKSEQLTIDITNGINTDKAFFKLNSKASSEFDVYDGYKLMNDEMNIYLIDDADQNLVMHTVKDVFENDKIFLGLNLRDPGVYTISFSNIENFRLGSSLFLIDADERQAMPVSYGSYTFTATDVSNPLTKRFYLSLTSEGMANENSILLYPNPVKDKLTIRISDTREKVDFNLFDLKGNPLIQGILTGESSLDLSDYPAGMYILRAKTSTGVVVKKIIKND